MARESHPVAQDAWFKQESKIIKIIYNYPGKQSEDQYGGDPSEDVGPPFPPVVDQQPIHVSPHCCVRVVRRAGNIAYVYGQTGPSALFSFPFFLKLVGTGDQRFVIGDAIGGCGGLRVASTL